MPMDGITQLRLLDKLDAMREAQIRHGEAILRQTEILGELLRLIRDRLPTAAMQPRPATSSPSFWRLIAENGRYWLGGIALIVWVWRGNDLDTVLQHLFR